MSAAIGGYGRVENLELLNATRYTAIEDKVGEVDSVRRELQVIIDAIPTQISPHERTAYLDAILHDLEDREDAAWPQWPVDVYLQALTCLRYLGRNPLGSTTLFTPLHLQTVLHHSSLPLPAPASPFSHPSPEPANAAAMEALRVLANLLVLHPSARDAFIGVGGGKALALALAGRDDQGVLIEGDVSALDGPERLFLLGRLAFLATVEKPEVVRGMVDTGDTVESLCYHLAALTPVPANYNAIAELLKVVMNVLRYYPSASAPQAGEEWDSQFDPLIGPILNIFHLLPTDSLAPPLSTCLHALFSIPFLPRLLPIWHSIPEPPSSASTGAGSVRGLINKISNLVTSPSGRRQSPARSGSPSEEGATRLNAHAPDLTKTDSRSRTSSIQSGKSATASPQVAKRIRPTTTTIVDSSAFPTKVLRILAGWFEVHMPYPMVADEADEKVMVDEVLPPVLLLMARAATGSEEFRRVFKEQLLPQDLDRSTDAGPLESRPGVLGSFLRLMHSSNHFSTRDSAGEFLWSICDSDATTLTAEIGYGNAAGFLFQKGITAPPAGKIQDIPDLPTKASASSASSSSTSHVRHPISSLSEPLPSSSDVPMTPEEKERESERLFVLFERMEKNPIIKLTPENPNDPGQSQSVREMMRDKLSSGELAEKEAEEEEDERRRAEEEDRADEEQVRRDMERYKARKAKLAGQGGA